MIKFTKKASVLLSAIALSLPAMAGVHWGYEGNEAPENWAQLSQEYQICQQGKNQSPVDISHPYHAQVSDLDIHYGSISADITNNGHTVQITEKVPNDYIMLDDEKFSLVQFHFHAPSENHIEGKVFPVEGHFVHTNENGELMVLAIMFEEGEANPSVDKMFAMLSDKENSPANIEQLDITSFLPNEKNYYRFSGSLTTPPCSEGVIWIVFEKPMTLSKEQIAQFEQTFKHHNNRPVQPLNGRVIITK